MGYTVHNFQPNEVLHASELNEMDAQILNNLVNTATIQTTNVAVKNYVVGEYLTYNGILYEVTAAIASGGTITPETNCTQTNVGAELTAANAEIASVRESLSTFGYLRSEAFTENTTYGLVSGLRQRFGETVFLSFEVNFTSALTTGTLFTVPSGYKPSVARGSMLAFYTNTSNVTYSYSRTLQINTSGGVTQGISGSMPSGTKLSGFFIYHTDDAEPS